MQVPDDAENENKCICQDCPTYDECSRAKTEILYCAKGKSICPLIDRGCICGQCPLWDEYKLSKGYFCLHGKSQ